jgi:DNA sulfur modification protein DndC
MERLEGKRVRERLSPNGKLPNSYVYSPVEDWSNDDVWVFLMQVANPWGFDNKDLLTMYQGASSDGECPLVIDATTPSCGDSRFGCWVCTLVEKDKSMQAMISNDQEKEWMLPLLELRNELDIKDDSHLRDFRRMSGSLQLYEKRDAVDKKRTELALIPGPYVQDVRERWLRRLLDAQQQVRARGPEQVRSLELITKAELQEIRRIWVLDKHEIEDNLPSIYEATTGEIYAGPPVDDNLVIGGEEVKLLREVCEGDRLHFEATRELLDIERRHRSMARRAGLFKELERALRKGFYEDADDARRQAVAKREAVQSIRSKQRDDELPLLFPLAEPQVREEDIA